jgi:hypothetical protein
MPCLTLFADPPDNWKEYVRTEDGHVTQRIETTAKVASFRTKVIPAQAGAEFVQLHFVAGIEGRMPEIAMLNDGAHAWVYVDVAALVWVRDQWALGRRIQVTFWSVENVEGFTRGRSPDGRDVVWDQGVAKIVKMDYAILEVIAQRSNAPIPLAPTYSDMLSKLGRITGRLDMLIAAVVFILVWWYWIRK